MNYSKNKKIKVITYSKMARVNRKYIGALKKDNTNLYKET